MTAFTDEFRSFVDCSVLASFGDCKFFFQTQMALLHPAMVWDHLAEDVPCNVWGIFLVFGSPVCFKKCCNMPFVFFLKLFLWL